MRNKNTLTELLTIDYPIIQAGMANVSGHELAATISNCGGLGTIGAGYMSSENLRNEVIKIKALTTKPFAVNLFIPSTPKYDEDKIKRAKELLEPFNKTLGVAPAEVEERDELQEFLKKIEVLIEEKVPIISFTFGLLEKNVVKRLKDENITLIGTATNVYEAKLNAQAGMDAVVLQGSEAGGHRGTFTTGKDTNIGLIALVPEVVDNVDIPVIAAGGIVDKRGIKAAHALGADGVQLGSLFLSTEESTASSVHKSLMNKDYDQTNMTKAFSGKYARAVQNKFTSEMKIHELELPDYPIQNELTGAIRKKAGQFNDSRFLSLWSGQGHIRNKENESAKTVFKSLIESECLIH